jgi:hypothetical protein
VAKAKKSAALGLRAAAKKLKISHVALLKAAAAGRVQRGADGKFDVEACRRQLAVNSNPGKQKSARAQQRKKPLDPDDTYTELCRRREAVKLEKDELNLARQKGELVPIGEVNAFISGMIIRARDRLLAIESDERTGHEIRGALRDLAEYVG